MFPVTQLTLVFGADPELFMAIFEQALFKSRLDPYIAYVKKLIKFLKNAFLPTLTFRSMLPETQDFYTPRKQMLGGI